MHRIVIAQRRVWMCLLAVACAAAAGCGDGMKRCRVRGTVTFQGKPVESGAIFFEPTASVGKIAPTAYLPIRNGKYDAGENGPVAGKYRVVVGGMDQSKNKVDDDGITHTPQLFKDYVIEVEIPPPNDTLDIEVPASQAIQRK